jgi:hypothetical protein
LPGEIVEIKPDLTTSVFTTTGIQNIGMAFAPAGFGAVGGEMLVSDSTNGTILAVDSTGVSTPFANVPVLHPGLVGLRQIEFAPAGFGPFGGDLLVSVSGSQSGGGIKGRLLALDGTGHVVGTLIAGSASDPFDPRGMFFPDSGHLLISDASVGRILLVSASDFQAVPEPASVALFALGALAVCGFSRWRRRRP